MGKWCARNGKTWTQSLLGLFELSYSLYLALDTVLNVSVMIPIALKRRRGEGEPRTSQALLKELNKLFVLWHLFEVAPVDPPPCR